MPPLIKQSFVFVPTAGMRSAPEVLVLEFMREVFFEHSSEKTRSQDLDPDSPYTDARDCMSDEEKVVVYALRGRRKLTKQTNSRNFFAPAYPAIAEKAWLRKSEAPVINKLLLGGPISQYLWHKGSKRTCQKKRAGGNC